MSSTAKRPVFNPCICSKTKLYHSSSTLGPSVYKTSICVRARIVFTIILHLSSIYEMISCLSITPLPSSVTTKNLYLSYPETIMSTLFSSIPRRDWAIKNISVHFGINDDDLDGLVLLVGRSSSGKTALMRLIAGDKLHSGNVFVNGVNIHDNDVRNTRPQILNCKPNCYDDSLSVLDQLVSVGRNTKSSYDLVKLVARDFAHIIGLTDKQLEGKPSNLSQSGQYMFGIVGGCMQSVRDTMPVSIKDVQDQGLYFPILLLDELFDSEHSSIAVKVGKGLKELTRLGGVVISATHKPQYLDDTAARIITLSGGEILTDLTEN